MNICALVDKLSSKIAMIMPTLLPLSELSLFASLRVHPEWGRGRWFLAGRRAQRRSRLLPLPRDRGRSCWRGAPEVTLGFGQAVAVQLWGK